jgi:hypothetical protein
LREVQGREAQSMASGMVDPRKDGYNVERRMEEWINYKDEREQEGSRR